MEAWQILVVLTVTVGAHLLYDWYANERHQSFPDEHETQHWEDTQ